MSLCSATEWFMFLGLGGSSMTAPFLSFCVCVCFGVRKSRAAVQDDPPVAAPSQVQSTSRARP